MEGVSSPKNLSEDDFRIFENEGVLKEVRDPSSTFASWGRPSPPSGEGMMPVIIEVVKGIACSFRSTKNIAEIVGSDPT